MENNAETALKFCCGVCACSLTDATALFTSCGHFFCLGKRCTSLSTGTQAGKCEQCGQKCDAGTLENKAVRYDNQVKEFVFASVEAELKKIAEIVKFHDRHYNLLVQNAASLVQKNKSLKQEIHEAVKENEALRNEIELIKQKRSCNPGVEVKLRGHTERTEGNNVAPPKNNPDVMPVRTSTEKLKPYQSYGQSQVNNKVLRHRDVSPITRTNGDNILHQDIALTRNAYNGMPRRHENTHLKAKDASAMRPSNDRSALHRYMAASKPYESITKNRDYIPPKSNAQHLDASNFRGVDSRQKLAQGRLLKRTSYAPQYTRGNNPRSIDNLQKTNAPEVFRGDASRRAPVKSTRLDPRTDPRSGSSVMPSYGNSLYGSTRIRKSSVPVNPSTVSKFCSTRTVNRSRQTSLHTTTRNLGKSSWQARVSTVPRPTLTTDDVGRAWKKQRTVKNSKVKR